MHVRLFDLSSILQNYIVIDWSSPSKRLLIQFWSSNALYVLVYWSFAVVHSDKNYLFHWVVLFMQISRRLEDFDVVERPAFEFNAHCPNVIVKQQTVASVDCKLKVFITIIWYALHSVMVYDNWSWRRRAVLYETSWGRVNNGDIGDNLKLFLLFWLLFCCLYFRQWKHAVVVNTRMKNFALQVVLHRR